MALTLIIQADIFFILQDLMFSEEDAEYSEALKMGPISAAVLDGDPKEPRVGVVNP